MEEKSKFSNINLRRHSNNEDIFKKIIVIQKNYRLFQFRKKQKQFLLNRIVKKNKDIIEISRIREINFQSLINNKMKKILKELILIESLHIYKIENFMESFDNLNYNHSKIYNNFKKHVIPMFPLSVKNINNPLEIDFYWGNWDPSGNHEGFGIKLFSYGGFYFGTFKKNKMNGVGIYLFPDKSNEIHIPTSQKKEDQFKMKLAYSKNSYLNESINDDSFSFYEEKNFIKNKNDEKINYFLYIGEFEENKLDGFGDLYRKNGDSFSGQFKDDFINDNCKGDYNFGK